MDQRIDWLRISKKDILFFGKARKSSLMGPMGGSYIYIYIGWLALCRSFQRVGTGIFGPLAG